MDNTKVSLRDGSIDILRSLAIIGIVIAHCHPDVFFTQLRSFDVILMVFLSAVCVKVLDKPNFNFREYAVKRFLRLIVPVWIFLTFYYAGVHFFYYLPAIPEILSSFAFVSDRYVWIIRILVVLALLAPFLFKITKRIPTSYLLLTLALCLGLSEVLFTLYRSPIYDIVFMTLPYGLVYVYGLNILRFTKQTTGFVALTLLLACFSFGIYVNYNSDTFIGTFLYKYPPQFFYVTYGMGISLLLWIFRKYMEKLFETLRISSFLKYVGQHTYWLYLWHIPLVDIVGTDFNPVIQFIIIFSVALAIVSFQYFIVKKYVNNKTLLIIFNG